MTGQEKPMATRQQRARGTILFLMVPVVVAALSFAAAMHWRRHHSALALRNPAAQAQLEPGRACLTR